jgi:SAM-dependent methyltransferase
MKFLLEMPIWACPYCKSPINSSMLCNSCNEKFQEQNSQPDLRVNRPLKMNIAYNYIPEFGYFPWENVLINWPEVSNGLKPDSSWDPTETAMLQSIENAPKQDSYALDIGCGENRQRFKEGLLQLGYVPVGIDISGNAPDALADAHCLPFADNTFDLIMSSAVFEHLKNPYVAINELYRVAKPGARIHISIAYNEPFHISYFHHSPLAVHELFSSVGLKPEKFILSTEWNSFISHLYMGYAGGRMPSFLQKMVANTIKGYSLLPARIKGIIKNDKSALYNAKVAFARSHSGSVGITAHKPY